LSEYFQLKFVCFSSWAKGRSEQEARPVSNGSGAAVSGQLDDLVASGYSSRLILFIRYLNIAAFSFDWLVSSFAQLK